MTDAPECPRCHRPESAGLLCPLCVTAFEHAAADLSVLLPELEHVVNGLDRVEKANTHQPSPALALAAAERAEERAVPAHLRTRDQRITLPATAMPVNVDALELLLEVQGIVAAWTAHLRAKYRTRHLAGPDCGQPCEHPSCRTIRNQHDADRPISGPACPARLCPHPTCWRIRAARSNDNTRWLLGSVAVLRRDPDAAQIVNDLVRAARQVEAAVDRRVADVYVGPCTAPDVTSRVDDDGTVWIGTGQTCFTEMYVQLGDRVVTCPACGTRYDVAERREWLIEEVREQWARPAQIVQALVGLGLELTQQRLDQWISRDRKWAASGRPRAVPYPPILQVGIDSDEVDDDGRPLGRALYRVGDVCDRIVALAQLASRRPVEIDEELEPSGDELEELTQETA